ncbi:hypothetical protein BACOVA_02102 [Bacteroides ovatus ATCC 8483]|jgi:hypothetical protein|uniref:Uncharacterized protein n=1 Tax=Bacteroides ovatus (strain ATCC 8483 / DSM 1896 / JCM 5824 / BCRC 10623 / CCUG 4943 / NCTC 11153) TaxID=411476 RepID=A0AAN3A9I6_BACO1|nr:hypothetical protein BACOVA_02102 [Bacteroides ovatus ATCC 8483]
MQHTKGDLIARGNPMVYCIYFSYIVWFTPLRTGV